MYSISRQNFERFFSKISQNWLQLQLMSPSRQKPQIILSSTCCILNNIENQKKIYLLVQQRNNFLNIILYIDNQINQQSAIKNMDISFQTSLFIFRRDLRLEDNQALHRALAMSKHVLPAFVLNPQQIDPHFNPYFNHKTVQFMVDSLQELDSSLRARGSRLFLFYGLHEQILETICKQIKIDAVFQNEDITPYAVRRKAILSEWLGKKSIHYNCCEQDYSLLPSSCYLKGKGVYYKSFTDYFRSVRKYQIARPAVCSNTNFIAQSYKLQAQWKGWLTDLYTPYPEAIRGGRTQAFTLLQRLPSQKDYLKNRNLPSKLTTQMAPFLKYGCISVRQFHAILSKTLGKDHDLIRQLYWRDFYYHLTYHFPHVEKSNFYPLYDTVVWADWPEGMTKWEQGKTGCPIVDAGMRQLAKQGWIPNIVRLLTANFLVKNLYIDWRDGERYFAKQLIDYDWGINNGSWQFVAATGKVQQPYYLIINCFNSKPFDPKCEYIKQWVQELRQVPEEAIHDWPSHYEAFSECGYPAPIVQHKESIQPFLKKWEELNNVEQETLGDLQDLGKQVQLEKYDMQFAYMNS